MRIALYGTDAKRLNMHKKHLLQNFALIDNEVHVSCYEDEDELKSNLTDYQVIFMEETIIKQFESYTEQAQEKKKITFTAGKEVVTFNLGDIYYVEAELSKIHLMTKDGEYVLPMTITDAEKILEAEGFIKTHRSYLVNVLHINRIKSKAAFLDNGAEIPISKYRLKQVRQKY
ncbi:MAG: LytR/AlgR family response regulator transcription factor, partial [Wujia sp.]